MMCTAPSGLGKELLVGVPPKIPLDPDKETEGKAALLKRPSPSS